MYKQIIEVKKGRNNTWTAYFKEDSSLSAAGSTEGSAKSNLMAVLVKNQKSGNLSDYRVHDVTKENL